MTRLYGLEKVVTDDLLDLYIRSSRLDGGEFVVVPMVSRATASRTFTMSVSDRFQNVRYPLLRGTMNQILKEFLRSVPVSGRASVNGGIIRYKRDMEREGVRPALYLEDDTQVFVIDPSGLHLYYASNPSRGVIVQTRPDSIRRFTIED